ncbi:MAG: hypothetical protein LBH98_00400 [Chitinispirillales bacterium]|nr:hypothetical protein [Chitinispirillales bacterium]
MQKLITYGLRERIGLVCKKNRKGCSAEIHTFRQKLRIVPTSKDSRSRRQNSP